MEAELDSELKLSPMEPADLAAVEAIEVESFSSPWSRDCFDSVIQEEHAYCLVARLGESLVGYAICFWTSEGFVVANLAVSEVFRGRGAGRKLLEAVLEKARASPARWALLDVRASNQAAIRLYLATGFRPVGRRLGYYSDPEEDSVVMALRIG